MIKVKLGDICTKQSSNYMQKDLDKLEGEYPVYGASGLIKKIDRYHQDKDYIAVVKDGAGIGRTMYLPAESSVIGTLQYLIPNAGIDAKYLYYAVKSRHLEKYYTGATIPHIYFKDYQNEPIIIHSKEQQNQIVFILGEIEKIIEDRKQELVCLENLVKARFVEMFGDPVANTKNWQMSHIEDVVSNEKNALKAGPFGSALKKEFYVDSGYKIYGQEQVISGDPYYGSYYIDEKKYMSLKNCAVQAGDVLISLVGTYGKLLIIPDDFEPGIINPRLMKITFDKKKINPIYFKHFFQSDALKASLAENTHGGTMDILNLGIVRKIAMPLPPMELQEQFIDFVQQVDKSKVTIQKALDEAQLLFDSLMQQYFG